MARLWRVVASGWTTPLVCTILALGVYVRTAAPSVLSGDSAEFQLAAATLGVAHPTTYPLFTMLGFLATQLLPYGDLARRVTLVSALCGALAIGAFAAIALRLGLTRRAAILGALLLAVSPGLWNAATVAEVYTLLALLMLALALLLLADTGAPERQCWLLLAGLVAGLGFTHHGLFTMTALPIFGAYLLWRWQARPQARWACVAALAMAGLGLLPWLYPLAQYARYGPFSGEDYGLPRHYFWGAPSSWAAVLDMLTGGTVRRGIFRIPTLQTAYATLAMVADRGWFEFGALGALLGALGCIAMLRRNRMAWAASAWVFLATLGYLLLLGPAVQDAPVFTLPMLLPWSVWAGFGCQALIEVADGLARSRTQRRLAALQPGTLLFALLLALALMWADTRVEYSSKRGLLLYREFGQATLEALPPNAVVIAHWEQGMALQYLRLVEQRRPDVWVDVVEPGDDPWGPRARRRYPARPVYLVGNARDVEGLPVELIRDDDYGALFRLRTTFFPPLRAA
jgi:hypothetical protein